MKSFTSNQLKFAGVLVILTITFRFGLSTLLQGMEFTLAWMIAAFYGILVFVAGWYFGKKDYDSLPLYDIGFKFHLVTYIICNLIAELWLLLGFQSQYEPVETVHLTALFWGLGLILHFILFMRSRKNSIKGIEKTDIFD